VSTNISKIPAFQNFTTNRQVGVIVIEEEGRTWRK